MRNTTRTAALAIASAVLAPLALTACSDSGTDGETIAEGVEYYSEEHTDKLVHVMEVDLSKASLDVLHPGKFGEVAKPQDMADSAGAVGVINGDFFNNDVDENEAGYTNVPVGPMISGGEDMKTAVPEGQRTGPPRPDDLLEEEDKNEADYDDTNKAAMGVTSSQVLGTELDLEASATTPYGDIDIAALNQYAIPEGEIGLFTSDWGISRQRAVCGTDAKRHGDCSDSVYEVTLKDDQVISVNHDSVGEEPLGEDEISLVARDEAVEELKDLGGNDPVTIDYELASQDASELTAALGGIPLLDENGEPRNGLESDEVEPRTAVGWKDGGKTLFMVVVDDAGDSGGATQLSLAMYAEEHGLEGAMNLDGGGSSLLATEQDGEMEIRNSPSDERDGREVANALAVFATPPEDEGKDSSEDNSDGEAEDSFETEVEASGLVGKWKRQGDYPTDVSSLRIEKDGSLRYHSEGSPVEYTGELIEAQGNWDYTAVLRAAGEDTDSVENEEFALQLMLSDDGQELTAYGEQGEFVYERED